MALRLPKNMEASTSTADVVEFKIYVGGDAPNSVLALRNLRALCVEHFENNFRIEVVDVLLSPQRAWDDGVMVTPTTVCIAPVPSAPLIGTLSNQQAVLQVLGLAHD